MTNKIMSKVSRLCPLLCINESKSGIMITIASPGSLKAEHLVVDHAFIVIHGDRISVVHCYHHLGGVIDKDTCMGPEAKLRSKIAGALTTPFRNHIVPKASLDIGQVATTIDAIIVSPLFHNSQTWCKTVKTIWDDLAKRLALAYASAVPSFVTRTDDVYYRYADNYISTLVERHDVEHRTPSQT